MNSRRTVVGLIIALIIAVVVIAVLSWDRLRGDEDDTVAIASFQECVDAGFPVMESDPPQCRTDDGQLFIGPRATPSPEPTTSPTEEPWSGELTSDGGVAIVLDSPEGNAVVSSPLEVRGSVPGSWSFEADFGLEVRDATGAVLGEHYATLQGEWMTEDMVEFLGTIEFSTPSTETGTLVLIKSNPSDDRDLDDQVEVPIRFN